ncbi:hypothetical protein BDZ89DRAFT_1007969 [Hymenopellis radicata]|nr:hypothetical protein BDZ89DRAFT_1007969 [Hymenopellis radicata]
MASTSTSLTTSVTMEDEFGIVYVVETAQQFWSELEDVLTLPKKIPTLQQLDAMLIRWLALCSTYHEQYLQSPLQLEHACGLLLDSELFAFHSERMCERLTETAQSNTNPHCQFMVYNVLLCFGRRRTDVFRSAKRWQPLIPLLMDHVLVEIDQDIEDEYFGHGGGPGAVVIEAKLRSLCVRLLYEMCRWQKLSVTELRVFDDTFIDYMFDLVEQTRHMQDESFNYSVIKFIVALNEQFMVASINEVAAANVQDSKNRVLRVLMRRLGSSRTFGENMIYMLNRAERSPDDLCMQLLVLKLIYLLFTTKGTSEYFYTNDLCVLVDVFLREVVDLDDDSESLRHTYLRVLHPLLTKTQLREVPYKRPQIKHSLESLVRNEVIRDINPTTRRLVERCLGGEWCVGLRKAEMQKTSPPASDGGGAVAYSRSHLGVPASSSTSAGKTLKASRSAEHLSNGGSAADARRGSETSLAGARAPTIPPKRKGTANSAHIDGLYADRNAMVGSYASSETGSEFAVATTTMRKEVGSRSHRREPPPAPPKRRKPPAIPVNKTVFTTIKSSSPLSNVHL